ncbi:ribonuclease Z, mitochondrial-like [Macrosteles quadrilineatus]|uniref:ribonuclease Z, mitochondrial-like n=1 Tax=Macrosteles quadrilineatus TaxID=74068 RepID=UPI0023E2C31C|nr:ribonuclease Z, mitochondrial-like [Macrosteles quadrilineatus]
MIFVSCFNAFVSSISKLRGRNYLIRLYSTHKDESLINLLNKTFKMPKPTPHTVALKKQRLKLKEKSLKYNPGIVNLQVLGSGAHGAPRCLYVFTDQSRYLFNCGEGTQRLAHEHKMKLSKLEHIFVTHTSWENIGGLPGVSLTIQDVGVPQITLHGPPGTDLVFSGTRRFVVLRHLAVQMASCERDTVFEDNILSVRYVPLYSTAGRAWHNTPLSDKSPDRTTPDDSTDDDTDYYAYWHKGPRSRSNSPTNTGSPGKSKKRRHLSPDNRNNPRNLPPPGSISMAYICRLQDRPGTLDLKACVSRGVPPGPLLARLKAGEDIQLPDGTIVMSKDVKSPDEPGPVFIVVECPNEEFLESLTQEELFKRHQSETQSVEDAASLVVHFTPASVMTHPSYRKWMSLFPPSTQHLVLNDSNTCLGSVAVHRIQHKLRLLSEDMFPLLADHYEGSQNGSISKHSEENNLDKLKGSFAILPGQTLSTIHLRPQKILDWSPKLQMMPQAWRQETLSVEGFPDELAALRQQLATLPEDGEYPHVVFLGTGSCIPSKTRNTSGILINLSESTSMIMDCGEATYGQLVRMYGCRTGNVLEGLRAIYVSHLHADHHIGLVALLRALPRSGRPIYLMAPKQIRTWLTTYHRHIQPVMHGVKLVPNDQLLYNNATLDSDVEAGLLDALGLAQVRTCTVTHCPNAFGFAITHRDGWKITYSGDTMPCDELVKLGKDSHLLIHEATMEDDLESEAKIKMHSTTSQAIEVGRRMGAKFTLLTHFSQRYAKVPVFSESFTPDVGIAFDNMKVRFCDIPKLPKMYNAMKLMFAEHYEEMEQKAMKRQLTLEREQRAKGLVN